MHPAVVLCALAFVGALAASVARQCVYGVVLAISLGALWATANIAYIAGQSDLIPLIDLPVAIAAYAVWRDEGKEWQRVIAAIMGARLGLHFFHPVLGSAPEAMFFHVLNALFVAACAAVAWEGGIHAVVDAFDRHLGMAGVRSRIPNPACVVAKDSL